MELRKVPGPQVMGGGAGGGEGGGGEGDGGGGEGGGGECRSRSTTASMSEPADATYA